MSEKEKMLQGLPYQPWEKQLIKDREYAKDIMFQLNNLAPSQRVERSELIKGLLDVKGDVHIESPFQCDYGYNIHLGENFYANHNCIILDGAPVTIGKNVLFAPNVAVYTAGHPMHHELRNQGIEYARAVTIKDNVWVGGNVVINPGVTIGENVVIASGSVVTKDIPDNMVVAGNPARILREITDADREYCYKGQKF